jgi:hypothetical protein
MTFSPFFPVANQPSAPLIARSGQRLGGRHTLCFINAAGGDEEHGFDPQDTRTRAAGGQAGNKELLTRLRDLLPSRYRSLLASRFLDRETLQHIGEQRGITKEGARLQLLEALRRARLFVFA